MAGHGEDRIIGDGEHRLARVSWAVMALAGLAYVIATLTDVAGRALWMDEVLAVSAARLPTVRDVLHAIWSGSEFSPPTYDLLLHTLFVVPGAAHSLIAPRLPSIVAGLGLAGCVAGILRTAGVRWPGAALGFALTLSSALFDYAVQARPYALMALAYGAALLVWIRWPIAPSPVRAAVGLFAALALTVSLHFYGVVLIASVGVMEALRLVRERQVRWPVWAALAAAGVVTLAWYPLAHHLSSFNAADTRAPGFYGRPRLELLGSAIGGAVLGGGIFLRLAVLGGVLTAAFEGLRRGGSSLLRGAVSERDPGPVPADLVVLLAGVATAPLLTWALSMGMTHAFSVRYVSAAAILPALAAPLLVDRLPGGPVVALVLATCCAPAAFARRTEPYTHAPLIAALERTDPRRPIIVGEGLLFIELSEAAPASLAHRLVYLTSPPDLANPDPTNEHQVGRLAVWRRDYRVERRDDFLARAPDYYLLARPGVTTDVVSPYLVARRRVSLAETPTDEARLYRSISGGR